MIWCLLVATAAPRTGKMASMFWKRKKIATKYSIKLFI